MTFSRYRNDWVQTLRLILTAHARNSQLKLDILNTLQDTNDSVTCPAKEPHEPAAPETTKVWRWLESISAFFCMPSRAVIPAMPTPLKTIDGEKPGGKSTYKT